MTCNQGAQGKLYEQQPSRSCSLCLHCNVPVHTVVSSTSFMTSLSHFAPLLFPTLLSLLHRKNLLVFHNYHFTPAFSFFSVKLFYELKIDIMIYNNLHPELDSFVPLAIFYVAQFIRIKMLLTINKL